jgi:hypothetical protein
VDVRYLLLNAAAVAAGAVEDTPSTFTLQAMERDTSCTSTLSTVERDTPCTSTLSTVERDTL